MKTSIHIACQCNAMQCLLATTKEAVFRTLYITKFTEKKNKKKNIYIYKHTHTNI
jgi:hypothetical protein